MILGECYLYWFVFRSAIEKDNFTLNPRFWFVFRFAVENHFDPKLRIKLLSSNLNPLSHKYG